MNNGSNMCGYSVLNHILDSVSGQDYFGTFYNAKPQGGISSERSMIYQVSLPTEAQYSKILADNQNNAQSAEEYISHSIDSLKDKLEQLRRISSADNTNLAPIYDFEIEKNNESYSYNIFVRTKPMASFAKFAKNNGLTFSQGIKYTLDLLSALSFAHKAGLYHGKISLSNIYADQNGACKLFGLVLAQAASSPGFVVEPGSDIIREDTVGIACIMYRIFNNLQFTTDNESPFSDSYRRNLYSGYAAGGIIAPIKSTAPISDVILKAFGGPHASYTNCEQFATAINSAVQTVDPNVLNSIIIGTNAPRAEMNNYAGNVQTPPVKKRKTSKGLLIGVISAGAALLIGLITLIILVVMFAFGSGSSTDEQEAAVAYFVESSVTLEVGYTHNPEIEFDNIAAHELVVSTTDVEVATVRNDSPALDITSSDDPDAEYNIVIQAVGEGYADITISDTNGNELGRLTVNVTAPDVAKIDTAYIEQILNNGPSADYGLYIIDVADKKEYEFSNSHYILGSSALVCLPIMYTYGKQVDKGYANANSLIPFSYTYPNSRGIYKSYDNGKTFEASQMMSSMLRYSDNNCINSFINYLSLDQISRTMAEDGLNETQVVRTLSPAPIDSRENKISAYDAGQMLYKMITNQVSPGKDFLISNFVISDGNTGMRSAIPAGAIFLNHNAVTSSKFNEIIYVESGDTQFIISFISNNCNPNLTKGVAIQIADYVYKSFSAA